MPDIQCYKNLACAIAIQAAKDYADAQNPQQRGHILRQLRSDYMNFITDGKAAMLADALKRDYKKVVETLINSEVE